MSQGSWKAPHNFKMGKAGAKKKKKEEQFIEVTDDTKLRASLVALADRYTEQIRDVIFLTYKNQELLKHYQEIRRSGAHDEGSKSKVWKKVLMYPNPYVADFVNDVMTALKGADWMDNKKNFNHELVRPWMVVDKI